jgi:hypothetical protein
MATASEIYSSERTLSDREFEELLERTWRIVQSQKKAHPLDTVAESPSWT